MSIKRLLNVLLSVTMLMTFVLVGCGNKSDDQTGSTKVASTSTTASTVASDTTTDTEELPLVNLKWYTFANPQQDFDAVIAKFSEEVKKKINATVNIIPLDYGTYEAKLPVLIATNEEFDLCFTSHWLNKYQDNALKGGYKELDELLDKYAPKLKASYSPEMLEAMKVNGKIYGLFNYQQSYTQRGMWFRKDLVDKYAFDYKSVKKYTDIEPFLEAVKKNEKGVTPLAVSDNGIAWLFYENLGFLDVGGNWYLDLKDPSITLKKKYERNEVELVIREWTKKGYIRSDAVTIKDTLPEVKAGKYACAGEGGLSPSSAGDIKKRNGFDAYVVPLTEPILDSSGVAATMTTISATSKNPERAMMLLELVNTDKDIMDIYAYGIKDKHYKINNGLVEPIKDSGYNQTEVWALANKLNTSDTVDFTAEHKAEIIRLNNSAMKAPTAGFNFQQAVVQVECDNLQSINQEFGKAFSCGALDVAKNWPIFVEKLKAAGVEKVMDEEKKQFEEFQAK